MLQLRLLAPQQFLDPLDSEAALRRALMAVAVAAVLEHSSGYSTEWVFRKALSGDILLLVVEQTQEPAGAQTADALAAGAEIGYVIAQVDTHSELRILYLFGVAVDAVHRLGAEQYRQLRAALQELARALGCTCIRAKSPRPGWTRIAEALGFAPIATEYEQAVDPAASALPLEANA